MSVYPSTGDVANGFPQAVNGGNFFRLSLAFHELPKGRGTVMARFDKREPKPESNLLIRQAKLSVRTLEWLRTQKENRAVVKGGRKEA